MTEKIKNWPGVDLSSSDIRDGKVFTTTWDPGIKYAWDTGIAYGRFLSELKEGRIIGVKCNKCERILVPPRLFCEQCFKETDEWVYVKDTGTVQTYSVAYTDWKATRITEPNIPCVIEIDGATKLMGFLHLLGEVDPKDIKIGMRVKAVWKPAEEREGAITDIKYFKPMEG